MKSKIPFLLLVFWLVIIFIFSNQSINNSFNTSDFITEKIITFIDNDIEESDKKLIIQKTRFIVRKGAHFIEYLILGILIYLVLSNFKLNKVFLISIFLCFLYACSDEIHQLFIIGRTPKILDVIIDISGSILGIMIINKIKVSENKN